MPIVTEGVQRPFVQYDWPGNVRELENACERTLMVRLQGSCRKFGERRRLFTRWRSSIS